MLFDKLLCDSCGKFINDYPIPIRMKEYSFIEVCRDCYLKRRINKCQSVK